MAKLLQPLLVAQRKINMMMRRIRVIPALLLQKGGLVKSVKFRQHQYIGDPVNAVRIFNDKEVDEIIILDISATIEKRPPNIQQIKEIASEAFMPVAYGGGISTIEEIVQLIRAGVEKVILNTSAYTKPQLLRDAAKYLGSQSIVVSIDVRKNIWGKYKVYVQNGTKNTNLDPVEFAKQLEEAGAGELFLHSIERDGTFEGYDTTLIGNICSQVKIPVIASGGAGSIADLLKAVHQGASAVSAGSLFVLKRPHRAVLISYPNQKELQEKLFSKIN